MRSIKHRVRDYLSEALAQIAGELGPGWRTEDGSLIAPDQRRFAFAVSWFIGPPGRATIQPVDVGAVAPVPTIEVSAMGDPRAIARKMRAELLPRCPPPPPPVCVRLSGLACRVLGYLDAASFEALAPDVAGAAARLLAGEEVEASGPVYRAELSPAAAWTLLEDWETVLVESDGPAEALRALEEEAGSLRGALEALHSVKDS